MNKSFVLVVLAISTFDLASCKIKSVRKTINNDYTITTQQNADKVEAKKTDTTRISVSEISSEKRMLIDSLRSIWLQTIDYSTFNGKAKMHYEGKDQNLDFITNFRLKKDSVIWVQINATILNMLIVRAYITPDSIKLIDYYHKEVTTMPFSRANELLPTTIEFSQLQNLIVGNTLRIQDTPTDASNFGDTWSVELKDPQYLQQLTYNKPDSTLLSSLLKTHNNNGPSVMIQYRNYAKINNIKFSNSRAINISNGLDQYHMDINFNNAMFNQLIDFPFSIPSNYLAK